MSIALDPSELSFRQPFNKEVTQTLHIKNTNYEPVAFKVKTTAPKQYCVRPNSGRIEAGQEVKVQVHLQPMKQDPPADYKCRDKFLVQSIPITADREASVAQIWSHVEKTDKASIQEKKIRVVFLQPDDDSSETATVIGGGGGGETSFENGSPPPYTSPLPLDHASTPTPASRPSTRPESYAPSGDAASTFSASAGSERDSELSAAKAMIAKLEAQVKQQELRLRKTGSVASDSKERTTSGAMGMTTHPPEGIPVQICAALCLGAFLIAWFFF